jgi:hypothetical protein
MVIHLATTVSQRTTSLLFKENHNGKISYESIKFGADPCGK